MGLPSTIGSATAMASMRRAAGLVAFATLSWMIAVAADSSEKTASDYYVHSLPGAPETPFIKMHAG